MKRFRIYVMASGVLDVEAVDDKASTALALLDAAIRKQGVQILGKTLANLSAHVTLVARIDDVLTEIKDPQTAVAEVGANKPGPLTHELKADDVIVYTPMDKVG